MAIIKQRVIRRAYRQGKQLITRSVFYHLGYRLMNRRKESFVCPICGYSGPFKDQLTPDTVMGDSVCLKCGAMERHRLQYLVMKTLGDQMGFSRMSMLHFAPEQFFQELFRKWFGNYTTADLNSVDVDYQADLRDLPFDDNSFDCVYASHVLEHIKEDDRALSEIARVLTPSGIAVLPVPIVAVATIEYPEAHEHGHVRAPGPDYFDKYEKYFSKTQAFSSDEFPSKYQLFICEDRKGWPTEERPLVRAMEGEKHTDIVPVAYASS